MNLNPTALALADGQLPNTKGTLYTAPAAPAGTKVVIPVGGISLVNTGAAANTVNIYVKPGATSRRVIPKNYALQAGNDGFYRNESVIVLEVGDPIEGDALTAAEVDYLISGYREDPI